jgi:hypothetical protein
VSQRSRLSLSPLARRLTERFAKHWCAEIECQEELMPLSRSPRILKGAFVRVQDDLSHSRVIPFQYNPEKLVRRIENASLAPETPGRWWRSAGTEQPRETITFTLILDATDGMERAEEGSSAVERGIYPALSAIELLMYSRHPKRRRWSFVTHSKDGALTLLVWGEKRTVPVELTELLVSETLHDPNLRPIRASVRVRMRVLTDVDLPPKHQHADILKRYLDTKADLASGAYEEASTLVFEPSGDLQ